MNEQYSFIPDISATKEIDEKLLENKGKYTRISDSRKQIEEYLRLKSLHTDLQTGQELFKPKISEYTFRNIEKTSRESYLSRSFSNERPHSHRLTSLNSEKILKRIKFLRFKTIFQLLSPNQGLINTETIQKSIIPTTMLKILEPLVEGFIKTKLSINFEEFCVEMEELLKFITPEQKNYIIKGEKIENRRSKSENLNTNTKKIKFNIYERNLKKLKDTRMKIEKFRRRKQEKEFNSCTFHPAIKNYSPSKPYANIWSLTSNSRLNQSSIN